MSWNLVLRALWGMALVLPLQAAPLAHAASPAPLSDDFSLLPPAERVMPVLAQLPSVRTAEAGIAAAQAGRDRLAAGPHEWSFKAGLNRRTDASGVRFAEQEFGLETAVRWPGKVAADRQLGDVGLLAGQLARADAWHEAGRSLLADWFDALHQSRSAEVLTDQARLAAQQLAVVQKRVQAGEAAQLDVLAAQADQARASAAAAQARTRAEALARTLARRYPGLPALPTPSVWPEPPPVLSTPQDWVNRILADNHELELAEALARQAQQRAERATLEQRGDPSLGVRATREPRGQEQLLGVYLSVPLGGAARQADVALALAEADRAEQQLAQTRLNVETTAWQAANAAVDERATWLQLEAARQHTWRSAELQARAYSLGEAPLADVLQARRVALEAILMAEMARLDALQSQARLWLDTHQLWALPEHDGAVASHGAP